MEQDNVGLKSLGIKKIVNSENFPDKIKLTD